MAFYRTCVGCRRKEAVTPLSLMTELVRLVVAPDGTVRPSRGSHGRGAWVHRTFACVDLACKRALPKLFATATVPSGAALWHEIVS